MENRLKFDISTLTILKVAVGILLVWLIYSLRDIVVLLFIVLVIVAAMGPLVDRMSKYIPRLLAVILLSVIFVGIITAIGFLIAPPIIEQIKQLAINLPYYVNKLGPFYENIKNTLPNYQENIFNFSSKLSGLSSGVYSTTISFIGGVIYLVTILVLSFYMLLEENSLKNFLRQTIPLEHKEKSFEIARKISLKMGSWFRGYFLLMLIIGILDGIALFSLGIPYALTLAVWGGLTEMIPYIGPWLGLIPAFLVALAISPWKALFVLIAFVIIQQLEGQFLAPKIMGKAVGLSPVIIILSLLSGAKLMGILGMIIAVPIAAVLSVLIEEWPEIKKISESKHQS
ncbi:MAG: AI-2E family transporter [Patescibacteria group bacterium]|nr:AI-2E family transporter [Patescibacteria group bacterium]